MLAPHAIEQRGDGVPTGVFKLKFHLRDRTLHAHQGSPVGLMKDPSTHSQQILKPTLGKLLLADADPDAENPVAAQDGAVFVGDNQATGGTVEKIFEFGQ